MQVCNARKQVESWNERITLMTSLITMTSWGLFYLGLGLETKKWLLKICVTTGGVEFERRSNKETPSSCIVGMVVSYTFEAWHILWIKSQDISDSVGMGSHCWFRFRSGSQLAKYPDSKANESFIKHLISPHSLSLPKKNVECRKHSGHLSRVPVFLPVFASSRLHQFNKTNWVVTPVRSI